MSIKSPGGGTVGPGGITGLANPSASIGLTAVNGSATTAIRSDGAPAIDQAIAPTWTGIHTFSNAINSAQGADIASAATTNLETATGNLVDVTGTTTITAITLSQGHVRIVRFTGALTLTNGASLVLPGGANILTAAGDFAIFAGYASSVVRCVGYFRSAVPYDTGSFTATATGFSGSVTGTAYYTRIGNLVTVYWPTLSGTSNATTFSVTGLPAALNPARVQGNYVSPIMVDNGGSSTAGVATLGTNGTLTLYKSVTATGTDWTNTGTKTMSVWQQTYLLN